MTYIHLDEAKRAAVDEVKRCLTEVGAINRALLAVDLFGKLRVVLWALSGAFERADGCLRPRLERVCGLWWTGEFVRVIADREDVGKHVFWEHAWENARADLDSERLRVLERHRN